MNFIRVGDHDLPVPVPATQESAGYDLMAAQDCFVPATMHTFVPCGFSVEIPKGLVGLVCSRSGLARNHGIFVLNAPGVIDSDYRGELGVILANLGTKYHQFSKGDKIAQIVFVPYTAIPGSAVRAGGFGSTG